MAKAKTQCCGTCGYAEWPKNKLGHRLKKNYVAHCLCPIPDLPDCVFSALDRRALYRNAVHAEMGKTCPKWRTEDHGRPHDAIDD